MLKYTLCCVTKRVASQLWEKGSKVNMTYSGKRKTLKYRTFTAYCTFQDEILRTTFVLTLYIFDK